MLNCPISTQVRRTAVGQFCRQHAWTSPVTGDYDLASMYLLARTTTEGADEFAAHFRAFLPAASAAL
jgi:hypothetical protein